MTTLTSLHYCWKELTGQRQKKNGHKTSLTLMIFLLICCSWKIISPAIKGTLHDSRHSIVCDPILVQIFIFLLISQTVSEIRLQNKAADLKAFHLDLTSFGSILKFKAALQQWLLDSDFHCSIQILINNAGVLAMSYRCTSEGYDQ